MTRITKVRVDGYESNVLYCLQQSTIKTLPAKDYFSYQPQYNLVCCSIEMNNSLSYFGSKRQSLMFQPSMKIAQIEKLLNLSKKLRKNLRVFTLEKQKNPNQTILSKVHSTCHICVDLVPFKMKSCLRDLSFIHSRYKFA